MYIKKDFSHLLGLDGFSDIMLNNHFTLYEGYVNNTNKFIEKFKNNEIQKGTVEFSELNRRFGWEWNGMRMHELYFENLTKENTQIVNQELLNNIDQIFGSLDSMLEYIKSVAAMRGIGWVILFKDDKSQNLFVEWISEHDCNQLVGCKPLLVMDVFEHAFMTDYGIKRADYINAFVKVIDWRVVESRYIS